MQSVCSRDRRKSYQFRSVSPSGPKQSDGLPPIEQDRLEISSHPQYDNYVPVNLIISYMYYSYSHERYSSAGLEGATGFRPRGSVQRSTFHAGQTRERVRPLHQRNGGITDDSGALSTHRSSLFSKLTSKFTRKYKSFIHICS